MPRTDGLPRVAHSVNIHASAAPAAAICVTVIAIAALLSAWSQNKKIVIIGMGSCADWPDTEAVNYFRIVKPEASSLLNGAVYDFVVDGNALHQGRMARYDRVVGIETSK